MTLVIGARCTDGILIAADTKLTDKTKNIHSSKLFTCGSNVLCGFSGTVGLKQRLIRDISKGINEGSIESFGDTALGHESFLRFIEKRLKQYAIEHADSDVGLDLIIGFATGEKSTLHKISYHEPVEVELELPEAIGTGEPYTRFLIRGMWSSDMNLIDTAALTKAIFNIVIGMEIDNTVGGYLTFIVIRNNTEYLEKFNDQEWNKVEEKVDVIMQYFKKFLDDSNLIVHSNTALNISESGGGGGGSGGSLQNSGTNSVENTDEPTN